MPANQPESIVPFYLTIQWILVHLVDESINEKNKLKRGLRYKMQAICHNISEREREEKELSKLDLESQASRRSAISANQRLEE